MIVVKIPARRLSLLAVGVGGLLGVAHTLSLLAHHSADNRTTRQLLEWFSLDGEGNFPALFSSLLLLLAAVQFGLIAGVRKSAPNDGQGSWLQWLGLAGVFAFLAVDEAIQIHEKFDNDTLLSFMQTSGFLAWPWVMLYGCLVLLFVGVYFKFWLRLPAPCRWLYAASASLYVLTALGLEMVGARIYTANAGETLAYVVVYSIEELGEMAAIALLIYANNLYFARHLPPPLLEFTPQ